MRSPSFAARPLYRGLRLSLVVWGFGYLLVALAMAVQGRASFPLALLSQAPLLALGVSLSLATYGVYLRARGSNSWLRWAGLALALPTAAAILCAVDLIYHYLVGEFLAPDWRVWARVFVAARVFTVLLLYFWTFCLAATLFWATDINDDARRHQARAAEQETATHRAEAAALRLQLNPHFLFNTLNAITSLVVTRRNDDAEEMIGQLADFLRVSISSAPDSMVRLAEEVATAEAYLRIEGVRFGPDRMRVGVDVPEALADALVPNFILQPLVENAVKHGVAPSAGPVAILVRATQTGRDLVLVVENQGGATVGDRAALPEGRGRVGGLGLLNIRQRLDMLYGERGALETIASDGRYRAAVRLPISREAI